MTGCEHVNDALRSNVYELRDVPCSGEKVNHSLCKVRGVEVRKDGYVVIHVSYKAYPGEQNVDSDGYVQETCTTTFPCDLRLPLPVTL